MFISSVCYQFRVLIISHTNLDADATLGLLHFWDLPSDLPYSDLTWFNSFSGADPLVGSWYIGR